MKSVVALGAGSLILAIAASSYDRTVDRDELLAAEPATPLAVASPASYLAPSSVAPISRYRATLDELRPSLGTHARGTRTIGTGHGVRAFIDENFDFDIYGPPDAAGERAHLLRGSVSAA